MLLNFCTCKLPSKIPNTNSKHYVNTFSISQRPQGYMAYNVDDCEFARATVSGRFIVHCCGNSICVYTDRQQLLETYDWEENPCYQNHTPIYTSWLFPLCNLGTAILFENILYYKKKHITKALSRKHLRWVNTLISITNKFIRNLQYRAVMLTKQSRLVIQKVARQQKDRFLSLD